MPANLSFVCSNQRQL